MHQDELRRKLSELHSLSYAWAIRCCAGDPLAAEEVLQDSYLKVLRKSKSFKGQSSFKTWLFSIIRYTALDYSKAKTKQKTFSVESFSEVHTSSSANTEDTADEKRLQDLFRHALTELSPQQRQVLHLVFYQAYSIREAAEIMEIQLGTARTHYERGKMRLRQFFHKQGIIQHML